MSNPWVKSLVTFTFCVGIGWTLYCLSPAGAAEREQTRQQVAGRRQMYRKVKEEDNK